MRGILAITWQDLRVFLSNKSNLPGLLVTPVVMTIIIGLVSGGAFGGPVVRRLDVVDLDGSPASSRFQDSIRRANHGLTLCPGGDRVQADCALSSARPLIIERALERVADGTSVGLLVIPQGFGQDLADLAPVEVTFRSTSEIGAAQAALEAVKAAVDQLNSAAAAAMVGATTLDQLIPSRTVDPIDRDEFSASVYQRALQIWEGEPLRVEFELSGAGQPAGVGDSLQQGLGQSVPGMGSMFVLMTVLGGMAALIVEKQQGTLQRLAIMPVPKAALLAGKILGRFSLGLLQFLVVLVIGMLLGMDFGQDPVALVLVVVAYTLSVTAISFAIGSRLDNPSQASGLSLLLALTLAPLGGAWWPLEISPRFMQIVGHVSPIAWAMEAFTKLTYERADLGDVWLQILALLGFALVAFLIAVPRFRLTLE